MELQGVQSSMAQNPAMRAHSRTLTDEQKTQLEEILAKYDPENMTEDDQKALMEELKDAKIPMGKDTGEILEKAGFERPSGPPPPPPGPPPQESDTSNALSTSFVKLMDQFQSGDISEENFLEQLNTLKEQILNGTGNVIDTTA
jgi:hypothetical protein